MLKIIFMGTPQFACPTLEKLIADKNFEIVGVYTREPQIAGRGHKLQNSPIHNLALKNNLKIFTPKTLKTVEAQEEFRNLKADAACVVAYGLLLPRQILDATRLGCFNIHPSLLPRWRGAAPIQRNILSGDKEGGVTIIKMDEGLDSGDMILQQKISLDDKILYSELAPNLSEMGAEMMIEALKKVASGDFILTKQDETKTTYAKKILKEECLIDWQNSAEEIDLKVRAFSGCLEAYFILNDEKIKIFQCEILDKNSTNFPAGKIIDDKLTIQCKQGLIRPLILQRSGKKPMPLEEFLRGFKF